MRRERLFLLLASLFVFVGNKKASAQLELVFSDSVYQLTGVAVDTAGRVFVTYPYWSEKKKNAVVEVKGKQKAEAYPNKDWNNWKAGKSGVEAFVCAQAVYVDKSNTLWVVDPASPFLKETVDSSVKVLAFDLTTNKVKKIYYLDSSVAGKNSYINDIQVDTRHDVAYLTNSNEGGIIVLDLVTEKAWNWFTGHYSTQSDSSFDFNPDGKTWSNANGAVKIHSDGIALSPDNKYLYYKPLTDDKLYRVRTKPLRNYFIKPKKMAKKVEDLGHVCTSDGMVFSPDGHLYLGDIINNSIVRYHPNKKKAEVVLKDEKLIWPDSYAISDDGYLYISVSQIHRMPAFNDGKDMRTGPFAVYRMKLPK